MGTKYNYKCDIWSFGILICELVGGFTPFSRSLKSKLGDADVEMSAQEMIELANSGNISLPKNLNSVTRDLIQKILVADPNQRIEIEEIKAHKFFKSVDWEMTSSKK